MSGSDIKNVALICDGNRRAAEQRGVDPVWGHLAGAEVIKGIMKAGKEWGIDTLTFWVWSTENWQRDQSQVNFVMNLATKFISSRDLVETFLRKKTRFVHLGRKDRLPNTLRQAIEFLEKKTADFGQTTVNLAMDYGGLDEASRAVVRLAQQVISGRFNLKDLEDDPETILKFLDTGNQSRPDLVIRTGVKTNEMAHTSGFMPLQTAYAGWQFEESFFPDFTPEHLKASIEQFISYQRRMGE